MKSFSAVLIAALTLGSGFARAQDTGAQPPGAQPGEQQQIQPPTPAPTETPPAPPQAPPAPPQQAEGVPAPAGQPQGQQGQWVYTQQYGWVWMPYGSQYTYAPTQAGAYPSEYVYAPSFGWSWVVAPWVFGWGIAPYPATPGNPPCAG